MKKYVKLIIGSLIILTMLVSMVGCGKKVEKISKLEEIKEKGKIILGTSADYPPYEFHKEINGEDTIVGFDIEIAKAMAKELGVELEIKDMKFDGLLAALKANKIDFIVSGMSPTEERKESIDFTDIYYKDVNKVLVRVADKDKYNEVNDFKDIKLGVQSASIQENLAKEQLPNAKLKGLALLTNLVLELENNKVDAILVAGPVAEAYAKQNNNIEVAKINFDDGGDGSAIAIDKGNEDLVKVMNDGIKKLKESKELDKFIKEANELAGE